MPVMTIPAEFDRLLTDHSRELARGQIRGIRLAPLLWTGSIETVLTRRRRLFNELEWTPQPYGVEVRFLRQVKPSVSHPTGWFARGTFEIARLSPDVAVLISTLDRRQHEHGPGRLGDRVYPLAKAPFVYSDDLRQVILRFAEEEGWQALSVDAMGYDRESGGFRRDMKFVPVAEAFSEMNEQQRFVDKIVVQYHEADGSEALRARVDRRLSVKVEEGRAAQALAGLIIPGLERSAARSRHFQVECVEEPRSQDMVNLVFDGHIFSTFADMTRLCDKVREMDGISVTVTHLNPYLHAQVLDFFTGATIDLMILDEQSVSLVPRFGRCGETLERVSACVFSSFGEPTVDVRAVGLAATAEVMS